MTAAVARIDTIPATGRYIVDTLHSTYDVDLDRCVFVRTPMHDEASNLQADDEPVSFVIVSCEVGKPMRLLCRTADGAGFVRTTTNVLGITPHEVQS